MKKIALVTVASIALFTMCNYDHKVEPKSELGKLDPIFDKSCKSLINWNSREQINSTLWRGFNKLDSSYWKRLTHNADRSDVVQPNFSEACSQNPKASVSDIIEYLADGHEDKSSTYEVWKYVAIYPYKSRNTEISTKIESGGKLTIGYEFINDPKLNLQLYQSCLSLGVRETGPFSEPYLVELIGVKVPVSIYCGRGTTSINLREKKTIAALNKDAKKNDFLKGDIEDLFEKLASSEKDVESLVINDKAINFPVNGLRSAYSKLVESRGK